MKRFLLFILLLSSLIPEAIFAGMAARETLILSQFVPDNPTGVIFLSGAVVVRRDVALLNATIDLNKTTIAPQLSVAPSHELFNSSPGEKINPGMPLFTHPAIQKELHPTGSHYYAYYLVLARQDLGPMTDAIKLINLNTGRKIESDLHYPTRKIPISVPKAEGFLAYLFCANLGADMRVPIAAELNGVRSLPVNFFFGKQKPIVTTIENRQGFVPSAEAPWQSPDLSKSIFSNRWPDRNYQPQIAIKNVDIIKLNRASTLKRRDLNPKLLNFLQERSDLAWVTGMDTYIWIRNDFYFKNLRSPEEVHLGKDFPTENPRDHGFPYSWVRRAHLDRIHIVNADNPSNEHGIDTQARFVSMVDMGDLEIKDPLSWGYQVLHIRRLFDAQPQSINARLYVRIDTPEGPRFSNSENPESFFEVNFSSADNNHCRNTLTTLKNRRDIHMAETLEPFVKKLNVFSINLQ